MNNTEHKVQNRASAKGQPQKENWRHTVERNHTVC